MAEGYQPEGYQPPGYQPEGYQPEVDEGDALSIMGARATMTETSGIAATVTEQAS